MTERILCGGCYCDKCNCCISPRRKYKNYRNDCYFTCSKCHDEKFSSQKFSLDHLGNDIWVIRNSEDRHWCGKHQWVSQNSSYFNMTPDCELKKFNFEELKEFVLNNFETSLY